MATTFRNEKLFCLNCGGAFALQFPIAIDVAAKKMKAFDDLHKDCKPTWVEPKADQGKDIRARAMWWIENGEVGASSETMWGCFMENKYFSINHPHDPDDFKRCYKLLQAIPEWKTELYKLKQLSMVWSNLVDNWDKLTEMYEENMKTNWKHYEKVGMYELMQECAKNN